MEHRGTILRATRRELPTLRRVLSAGAPVPPHVLQRMKRAIHPDGDVHTPYGATEALPVASISASEVLGETAARLPAARERASDDRFPGIEWKVIRIVDGPIADIRDVEEMPRGEIGELIVRGPVVTTEYVTRRDANALHKMRDGEQFWHRMGDVGYLDEPRSLLVLRPQSRIASSRRPARCTPIPCEAHLQSTSARLSFGLVGIGAAQRTAARHHRRTWPDTSCRIAARSPALVAELTRTRHAVTRMTSGIRDILTASVAAGRHPPQRQDLSRASWPSGRPNS